MKAIIAILILLALVSCVCADEIILHNSADINIGGGTWKNLTWDSEIVKSGISHSTIHSSERINITKTGNYSISLSTAVSGSSSDMYMRLEKNNNVELSRSYITYPPSYSSISLNGLFELSDGDYITIQALSGNAASVSYHQDAFYPYLSVLLEDIPESGESTSTPTPTMTFTTPEVTPLAPTGVLSIGTNYISWSIPSDQTIVIDGVSVYVYMPIYTQSDLTPGSIHYAVIDGTTYTATTLDDTSIWYLWAALFIAYLLILLVYRFPIALLVVVAYDLWLAFVFMPSNTSIAPIYTQTAAIIALAASFLAFGKQV